jgi:hypothetical protein
MNPRGRSVCSLAEIVIAGAPGVAHEGLTASLLPRLLTSPLRVFSIRRTSASTCKIMNISRNGLVRYLTLGILLTLGFGEPVPAAQEEAGASIQQMMSPAEFRAAGLNKLSPDELQKLDAWLQGYRQTAEKKATSRAERTKLDLLVSRVDGSFNGLTGRTIIRLEDGTAWKQANADDRFHPRVTDHPAAAVVHTIFGYRMRIEGTPEFYVDPVRNP